MKIKTAMEIVVMLPRFKVEHNGKISTNTPEKKWVAVEDLLKWLEDNFCLHGTGGDIYNKIKEEVALDE